MGIAKVRASTRARSIWRSPVAVDSARCRRRSGGVCIVPSAYLPQFGFEHRPCSNPRGGEAAQLRVLGLNFCEEEDGFRRFLILRKVILAGNSVILVLECCRVYAWE